MPYLHADLHPTIRERDFRKNTDLLGRDITIVMPCLNEAETLETCISDSHAALREAEICGEVLIADNGSTDGSLEIARQSVARVVDVAQRGYGAAVQSGIAAARSEFIVMGDGGWGMGDGGWGMGDGGWGREL